MARRKKTSPVEDLMDLVAMLPWWAGVAFALLSYLILGRIAAQQVVAATQPGQVGAMLTQTLWKTFASVGQYVLPIICLAGAGMSAWRRKERKNLVVDVTQSKASDAPDGMSWREFEMLVGEGFRLQGYQVVESGGGGADGGVDLVLSRPGKNGGEKFLVQCKQWRAFKVGGCGARAVRRDGREGRHRWIRGHLGAVHRRCNQLCERPQRDAGRWAQASRAPAPSRDRSRSFTGTTCGGPSRATQATKLLLQGIPSGQVVRSLARLVVNGR